MKKYFVLSLLLLAVGIKAEEPNKPYNPTTTVVPFLTMTPDARAGGMGDVGAATSADPYSQFWNPAKFAFAESKAGIAVNYTPWLRKLTPDIDLANIAGYYNFNNRMAISASFTYFSMGSVLIKKSASDGGMTVQPNEFALDLAYSLRLSPHYSMAVNLRYIRSDLSSGTDETQAGNAFSADLAGFLTYPIAMGANNGAFNFGFNLSNLGTKISYDGGATSSYIPANMRLGAGVTIPFDAYNKLSINVDANRYLVPQMPLESDFYEDEATATDEQKAAYEQAVEGYDNGSSIGGIFTSFAPANYSIKNEFDKIKWSAGLEYSYNNQFFVRTGYFYEAPSQGNRQFVTFGAGFKMYMFQLDVSYYVATAQNSPLDQTLRFSLVFDFDGLQNLIDKTSKK